MRRDDRRYFAAKGHSGEAIAFKPRSRCRTTHLTPWIPVSLKVKTDWEFEIDSHATASIAKKKIK